MSIDALFFWIGTAGMAFGALAFLAMSARAPREDRHHYLVSFLIVLVAATSYFAMALGVSHVTLADGHTIYVARYIDWAITTPLLLLGLVTIGIGSISASATLVYGAIASDLYMIATGFVGALSIDRSRWMWFVFSCGGFVAVLGLLWGPIRMLTRERGCERAYVRLTVVLTALWFVYPIVWIFGDEGLRVLSSSVETVVLALTDLAAKVVFGFLSLRAVAEASREHARARSVERAPGDVLVSR